MDDDERIEFGNNQKEIQIAILDGMDLQKGDRAFNHLLTHYDELKEG